MAKSLFVRFNRNWVNALLIPILFNCCTEVKLIGAYNQNVDQNIQIISKDFSTLCVQIETNIKDGKDYSYETLRDSYIKIEGEVQSCIILTNGLPKYKLVTNQLNILDSAFQKFKALHVSFGSSTSSKQQVIDAIEVSRSGLSVALSAMLKLQEGLKREKADKN